MRSVAEGILCALVTPFRDDGGVDEAGLEELVRRQMGEGVRGFLILGPVGEGCSLDEEEWKRVLEQVVDLAGSANILVEVSCPAQKELERHLRWAADAGVAGITALPPPWYGYSREVLASYYRSLVERCSPPVYLHHMPRACGVRLSEETLRCVVEAVQGRLAGLVECSGDRSLRRLVRRLLPHGTLYHGRVDAMSAGLEDGAIGAVVATANLCPGPHRVFWNLRAEGKIGAAKRVEGRLEELAKSIHETGWPVASNVKAGLARLMRGSPWVRPPLMPLTATGWDPWGDKVAALVTELEAIEPESA